jgi:hypothetical protein
MGSVGSIFCTPEGKITVGQIFKSPPLLPNIETVEEHFLLMANGSISILSGRQRKVLSVILPLIFGMSRKPKAVGEIRHTWGIPSMLRVFVEIHV